VDSDSPARAAAGRDVVEARIPHRDPFLFVDRIVEEREDGITTEWDVRPDAFFFVGHYPGNPILPGVIMNEFVFQSAALYMSEESDEGTALGGVPVLTRIEDARFKSMVKPGETLRADLTLTERLGPACYMRAKVTSAGRTVVRLSFVVAMAPPEETP
jgi:3-hydroxyacyl-[acyl-carrier-protein] dehydratase